MISEAKHTTLAALQAELPSEWDNKGLRQQIKRLNDSRNRKIIVLDDDPTGVQTVHDIDVLTMWDKRAAPGCLRCSRTALLYSYQYPGT